MRKTVIILVFLVSLFHVLGCASGTTNTSSVKDKTSTKATTTMQTTSTAAQAAAVAPAPTPAPTPAPAPAPAPVPTPSPAPVQSANCDPNYSGCVPIDSDVDCAGGSGNGPSYVSGPVTVVGSDIYGLDGDGDGIGCE